MCPPLSTRLLTRHGESMGPVRRRRLGCVWTAILVGLVGACANEGDLRAEQALLLGFRDLDDHMFAGEDPDEARIEQLVAACMAEAGFEYEAELPDAFPGQDGSLTLDEYRELHGWGIMSSWEHTLTAPPTDLDPNEELLAQMDEATRVAWELALYGPPDSWYDDDQREGCRQEAEYQTEFVNTARWRTAAWSELQPLLTDMNDAMRADPSLIGAEQDWSRCMAESGYRFSDVDEAIISIDERLFDAWENATPPPGEAPPEQRWDPQPWFVRTDPWQELVQHELHMAAASAACSHDQLRRELESEYRERFLEENQDLILQLQTELEEIS